MITNFPKQFIKQIPPTSLDCPGVLRCSDTHMRICFSFSTQTFASNSVWTPWLTMTWPSKVPVQNCYKHITCTGLMDHFVLCNPWHSGAFLMYNKAPEGPSEQPKQPPSSLWFLCPPSFPIETQHMELRVRSQHEVGAVKWPPGPPRINCSLCCWKQEGVSKGMRIVGNSSQHPLRLTGLADSQKQAIHHYCRPPP